MKRTLASALGTTLLLILQAGASQAASSDSASEPDDVTSKTLSGSSQDKAQSHWTAARMKNAKPGDALVKGRKPSKSGKVAAGKPKTYAGSAGKATGPSKVPTNGGGLYTGGGKVVNTTGKVFFTLGGSDYVCSGSSTTAASKNLVQTAGHCVNEGPGAFATNWVFVPGYTSGNAPYGQFAARKLTTTSQWSGSGNLDYDVAYAVVNPVGGKSLTDTVGAQGVGFNLAKKAQMYSFGYPAASPYDGEKIATCSGAVVADTVGSSTDQGLTCDMTGGSSGGPWFINYTESTGIGTLNSLNSFKYTSPGVSDKMYGPYFGSVVQTLYTSAQSQ